MSAQDTVSGNWHSSHPLLWRVLAVPAGAAWLFLLTTSAASAAAIRMEDGTTVTGDVLRTDDDDVILRVPRDAVDTIDGISLPHPLTVGMSAPAFTVTDVLGHTHTLSASTGKITVLHFWISWCPFCQTDAPQIQALDDRFRDNTAMRVLSVSLDDDLGKVERFMKERKVTYPVILAKDPSAPTGRVDVGALYQISGFPVTYVIDAKGVIQKKVVGSFVKTHVDLDAFVRQLISKPPSSSSRAGS